MTTDLDLAAGYFGQEYSEAEHAAQYFETRPRKWASPLALAYERDRTTRRSPALVLIDRELVALMGADEYDALEITMPPQEGKSQEVSRNFPEWNLEHDQGLRIAIASYEQEMALRWGRDIKQDIALHPNLLPISIRLDSKSAGRWGTPAGGGVYCVGIGGPLTGQPVDILIIDDPVKDRAAAESDKVRGNTWDWWESVALTRLAPGGKVVLVQTRWHQDDLTGRISSRPSPLRWRRITIPAIANRADDPLGRALGEELVSVRGRAPGHFRHLQATMSAYAFSGLYQQSPTAAEGNMFRRAAYRYWRPAPPWPDGRERISREGALTTMADCWYFHTMDFAASTKTAADYTVCSTWAVTVEGDLVLLDRVRGKVGMHEHFDLAKPQVDRYGGVIYAEHQFYSKDFVTDARDAGYPVAEVIADVDKLTRAIPAAGRVHAGKVWFPAEVPWLDEWCDELAGFPNATHDDQVDTLAYAALVITNQWTPAKPPPRNAPTPHERAVQQAYQSALGQAGNGRNSGEGGELDIMNVPW